MTLTVAVSRRHDYALITGDSSCYLIADGDDDGQPIALPVQPKALALTDYVLIGVGGCRKIGQEFRELIRGRVRPEDDVDACYAAARDVVARLIAEDHLRAGQVYERRDGLDVTRMSIRDGFSLMMTGFRRDGTTLLVQCREGELEDYDDAAGEFSCGVPLGVDVADVIDFYENPQPSETLAQGFGRAFAAHHVLGEKYPDRVTRDINVAALLWLGESVSPYRLEFTCYRDDIDEFQRIWLGLATDARTARARTP